MQINSTQPIQFGTKIADMLAGENTPLGCATELRLLLVDVGLVAPDSPWSDITSIYKNLILTGTLAETVVDKPDEFLVSDDWFRELNDRETVTYTTQVICAHCGHQHDFHSNKQTTALSVRKDTATVHTIHITCPHCDHKHQLTWIVDPTTPPKHMKWVHQ